MVRKYGFSLVELVIVIVIVGIIAAIAIPRVSQGSAGADAAALQSDLRALRSAIELYAAEHNGNYPSTVPDTLFADQLTKYTDEYGNVSDTKTHPYIFGPYLSSIPTLKVGEGPTSGEDETGVGTTPDSTVGWIFDPNSGKISANSGTAQDKDGTEFSEY